MAKTPFRNQPVHPSGEVTLQDLHCLHRDYRAVFSVVDVEMRGRMVAVAHVDRNSQVSTDLRHGRLHTVGELAELRNVESLIHRLGDEDPRRPVQPTTRDHCATVRFTAFSEEGGAQAPRPVEEDDVLKRLLSEEVGIDPGHVDQIIQRLREEGAVTIPNVHLTSAQRRMARL